MFTGIIGQMASIEAIRKEGENIVFVFESAFPAPIKVDQSIAHNGVCLTVTRVIVQTPEAVIYEVVAVEETLSKTDLKFWKNGQYVNTELCMKAGDRLDGHFVQGHVDTTGIVSEITERDGSWLFHFQFDRKFAHLLVDRGSVTVNGVSLTVVDAGDTEFTVTIIPYTFENTVFRFLEKGDTVNLEFDILGKYMHRFYQLNPERG
ncbi:MAG: riboflavin synthase [Bacteroidia bacterium]|nr:riboflavin synthase [Bacteroidia bacterium]